MLNFKYIKERASAGSWRRGYNYFKESQLLDIYREKNTVKAKVKGNFQDFYNIELTFDEDGIHAKCDCPLEEEWCKHAVAVGLESVKRHYYDEYITEETGKTFEYPAENPPPIENFKSAFQFVLNPDKRPKFISVQIIERKTQKVIDDIEGLLKAFIAAQKADPNFELNDVQRVELAFVQELYKQLKPSKKYQWYDIPVQKFEIFLKYMKHLEEVIDYETQKRLIFSDDEWKLVLAVNVSAVGNVLLSLHWHTPNSEEVLPFEEVKYFSRTIKYGQYKNLVFPTNVAVAILPHYLTKSTFTDIRDADGGKFVYEELPKLKKLMDVEISETLEKLTLSQHLPKNVVKLTWDNEGKLKASLDFDYDGILVPYSKLTQKTPYVTVKYPKEDLIYWIKRNLKLEKRAYEMLVDCKFIPMQTNNLYLDEDEAIDFFNYYMPRATREWFFESEQDLDFLQLSEKPLFLTAKVDFDKNSDSFHIELGAKIGRNRVDMELLYDYMSQGRKYLYINRKGYVEVPTQTLFMIGKALSAFDAIQTEDKKYHIKTFRAGIISELEELGVVFSMSKTFEKFWGQISTFNTMEQIALPKGLHADLREYQIKGLNWLWFLYSYGLNGILADDMGLGKTLQALAMIQKAKEENKQKKPALVICPTTVVFNWENEIKKFTPDLKTLNLTGSTRSSLYKNIKSSDIVITSYAIIRRDIELLKKHEFRFIILDEAQNIKNADSQTAQATKMLNGQHKFALSGTPIENRLSELWSIFDFLMPDFLYDINEFNYRFGVPITEKGDKTVESRLKKQIYPFILRRMKRDVAKDLPDKVENIAYCEMTPEQREFYLEVLDSTKQEIFNKAANGGFEKNKLSIFAALLRLRQICCHPRLFDKDNIRGINESGKFEKLKSMLEEIIEEGHKVLIFSQFVEMLDIMRNWLQEKGIRHEYLTGQTKDRKEAVERFNSTPSIPIFLISLKAGGTGLNLTGADYVIHYDPWWNPAVEDQATDRAYRIGQTKKVFVYRIITKGTVEEKIQKLKERKRNLVDSVISADRDIGKSLTYDDLKEILSLDY